MLATRPNSPPYIVDTRAGYAGNALGVFSNSPADGRIDTSAKRQLAADPVRSKRDEAIADLLAEAGCFDGARKFRQIAREHQNPLPTIPTREVRGAALTDEVAAGGVLSLEVA